MSFDEVKDELRDLEALKNYERVKEDLDKCMENNRNMLEQLETQKKENSEREFGLLSRNVEIRDFKLSIETLERQLKACEERAGNLNTEKEKLRVRVDCLGKLKATVEGKTLSDVEAATIKAQDAEIERRASDRLKTLTTKWETEEKPKQLREAAVQVLREILGSILRSVGGIFKQDVAKAGLPGLLTEVLENEVKKRMNDEIKQRIESEAEKMSNAVVAQLVTEEWPRFLQAKVEPMVQQIISELRADLPRFLAEPMIMACNNCGNEWRNVFHPKGIDELIRRAETTVTCPNESCRLQVRMKLSDWIKGHLGVNQPSGPT